MTTSEMRDYATMVAAIVAVLVFVVNVISQSRGRRIENLARFNQVHQRLFARSSFIGCNLTAIEAGTLVRDPTDAEMETQFHLMLLEIERLAILANNKAVPRQTQVYMFGSYAPQIRKLLTKAECDSMFWELAVGYLDEIIKDTQRYSQLTRREREKFWS